MGRDSGEDCREDFWELTPTTPLDPTAPLREGGKIKKTKTLKAHPSAMTFSGIRRSQAETRVDWGRRRRASFFFLFWFTPMSQSDFEQSKITLSYAEKTPESSTETLETVGQLEVRAKEIRGTERPQTHLHIQYAVRTQE